MSELCTYQAEKRDKLQAGANGHTWEVAEYAKEYGYLETYQLSQRYCDGPKCTVCGYTFCRNCHDYVAPEPCRGG